MKVSEHLDQTWNLDVFFAGGSDSPAFAAFLDNLVASVRALEERVRAATVAQTLDEARVWSQLLQTAQEIDTHLSQALAFAGCLSAQDMHDEKSRILLGQVRQIRANHANIWSLLEHQILQMPDQVWQALLADEQWTLVSYRLQEMRRLAKEKLPSEQEALVNDLSVDGYHSWREMYESIVGRIAVPFERNGQTVRLSAGQLFNLFYSSDHAMRRAAAVKWEQAWDEVAPLCAEVLNHLAGFRLNLYRHRGWTSVLREPLANNRIREETLRTMWDVVEQNKAPYVAYMQRKARLFGLDALTWYDQHAPVRASTATIPYEEAATFIVEHFQRFSPAMSDFARRAFRERWIEAEDRPNKRPGGFCSGFPLSRQSRIFLTYAGTAGNISTIAHELGHAWHHHMLMELPGLAHHYPMTVGESASTFAEQIVGDAAVRNAKNDQERIALLADKIENAVAVFMNIHARFLFETEFYEERRQGMLSVDRLNELMTSAQRRAYRDVLSQWHPTFWASKLHFYHTGQPVYNFPYTFGYLFSAGIYAQARAEGPTFEGRYVELLRDTGRMSVEDLAMRHLGADLTRPDFWQSAMRIPLADVHEFLRLTE